jgi:hypothetical protein
MPLLLPSGRQILVPTCRPLFHLWTGPSVNSYGGKPVLNYGGKPLFAELVVLNMLTDAGWEGFWTDSYRRRYRIGMRDDEVIVAVSLQSSLPFEKHPAGFQKFGGCWDVVAWKGENLLFCECKRSKRDVLQKTQFQWVEDRLSEGATIENFRIVEWSLQDSR